MKDIYSGVERRRFKRIKINLTVVYRESQPLDVHIKTQDTESKATMVDISEGGICIITDISVPVSTILIIKFSLLKMEQERSSYYGTIEILGRVQYSILVGQNTYRLGISFEQMDDRNKVEIINFLNMLERSANP